MILPLHLGVPIYSPWQQQKTHFPVALKLETFLLSIWLTNIQVPQKPCLN